MILISQNIDINLEMFNPSITLFENSRINKYSFPDPNSYYILSEAGKYYTVIENATILISPFKEYYEQLFYINDIKSVVLKISNELFKHTNPIEGDAKAALELAIFKSGKKQPTLKNRL